MAINPSHKPSGGLSKYVVPKPITSNPPSPTNQNKVGIAYQEAEQASNSLNSLKKLQKMNGNDLDAAQIQNWAISQGFDNQSAQRLLGYLNHFDKGPNNSVSGNGTYSADELGKAFDASKYLLDHFIEAGNISLTGDSVISQEEFNAWNPTSMTGNKLFGEGAFSFFSKDN